MGMADTADSVWADNRRRLLDLAYRMLGSRSDADDVVQDAYLRLSQANLDGIQDPTGWLVTVTGRLCIDRLRSSRAKREAYVGPWLPEPILGSDGSADPADQVTLDDSVRMAMLVVMEQLTPPERAAFILHDVFQIPFDRIAEIVGRSPQACRQLASRARRRLSESTPPRFRTDPNTAQIVLEAFADACENGDIEGLVEVLDPEVQGLFDSGGHIRGAPTERVVGARKVASILTAAFADSGARLLVTLVNGEPGVKVMLESGLVSVIAVEIENGLITKIHGIGNPMKLGLPAE